MSAAQRQAQIERIRDGLNSPDPTKRLVTLEGALAMKDATLRRVALSTAFASSDSDLRSAALAAALSSTATFVVDITGGSNPQHYVTSRIGSSFEVRIRHFDRSSNTFESSTSSSYVSQTGVTWLSGAVSGERLSFDVNVGKVFTTFGPSQCRGVARLESTGSALKGSMNCTVFADWEASPENFLIAVDVLK